jgi:hypothetical protein
VVLTPPAAPFTVTAAAAADAAGDPGPAVAIDWPSAAAPEIVPDWPGTTPEAPETRTDQRVVLRGDCLWDIAAAWLLEQHPDAPVTEDQVRRATQDWWRANAAVIGPDPDLLLPGQVLRPPG